MVGDSDFHGSCAKMVFSKDATSQRYLQNQFINLSYLLKRTCCDWKYKNYFEKSTQVIRSFKMAKLKYCTGYIEWGKMCLKKIVFHEFRLFLT